MEGCRARDLMDVASSPTVCFDGHTGESHSFMFHYQQETMLVRAARDPCGSSRLTFNM